MKVIKTIEEIKKILKSKQGYSIGFVPTMGALHEGHLSLIKKSTDENETTVVSIFVNPKQFNNAEDLKKYPRILKKDIALLEKTECNILFAPTAEEIYYDEDEYFYFGHLEEVMEGKHRPGHFNGVAQVVSRLFKIIEPDKAYFGLKDFQQLAIIRRLTKILDMSIKIVACPIVREVDGLAMSSRNVQLSKEERKNAVAISQTLFKSVDYAKTHTIEETKKWVIDKINETPLLATEYFEIVDDIELKKSNNWNENNKKVGCVAVMAGNIRLIDNIQYY